MIEETKSLVSLTNNQEHGYNYPIRIWRSITKE